MSRSSPRRHDVRGRRTIPTLLAALTVASVTSAAGGAFMTVQQDDFESGAGAGWSVTTTTTDAAFTQFLGRFGNETVEFSTATEVDASMRVTFDLYVIDRWRGDQGNDSFTVEINGLEVFNETLHNSGGAQSYPIAPDEGGVNLGFKANRDDSIYRSVSFDFTAAAAVSTIRFRASGLPNNVNNASWGIDNMRLEQWNGSVVIPTPGPAALASVGMGLLLFSRPLRHHQRSTSGWRPTLAPA